MIGIICGLEEEADAIFPGEGDVLSARTDGNGIALRRIERNGGEALLIACGGIGKVAAATTATLLATRYEARLLMVVGTAGALSGIGGAAHWLSAAIQHDYGAAKPDAFVTYPAGSWPIGEAVDRPFAAMPQPAGLDLPETIIASGDCFVECGTRAGTIRDNLSAHLVDMETAAVAQCATILGLPWCAIKAASDGANADSAGDFHANLLATARRAAVAAEQVIGLF